MQHLMVQPHPLCPPAALEVPSGMTLRQMLVYAAGNKELAEGLVVTINGEVVPEGWWTRLHPKPGSKVCVCAPGALQGGNTRQILGIVVMLVVSYFAPGWGQYAAAGLGLTGTAATVAGYAISAGIMLTTSLAVSALIAPHTGSGATGGQDWRALTGTQNSYNQWGVIPCVIGQHRFYPPHAALPYSETIGEKSYHYYLFDLGYGDLDVSGITIGDTSIDEYEEVQYRVTTTPTLYKNDVNELTVGVTMDDEGDETVRTTSTQTERISMSWVYTGGLFGVGESGKKFQLNTIWAVHYCPTGTEDWQVPPNPNLSGLNPVGETYSADALNENAFGVGLAWDVPAGQYDVRLRRVSNPRGSSKNTYRDSATWTSMRSIRMVDPSRTGTNKLEVRILATDQLTGQLATLSLLVGQRIKTFDPDSGTWTAPAVVTNAAWVTYWYLTECPALSVHVPSSRIDLANFVAAAEFCDRYSLEIRDVLDSSTNALAYIRKLLAGSMADLGNNGQYYRLIFDDFDADDVPTWEFLPTEITNFKETRTFIQLPHALRVQFVNAAAGYIDDEVIVLDDGYSYRGVDAFGNPSDLPEPTIFETLKLEQAMFVQQAWRNGRFHLAQGKFRPEVVSFDSDIAGFGAQRGRLVYAGHHVTDWGVGFGRVHSIAAGAPGGRAATLVLDEDIATEPGVTYSMQIRGAGGGIQVFACTPASPMTSTFYLDAVPAGVRAGDTAALGTTGKEIAKVLLTSRRNGSNFGTSFTSVRFDTRVKPYWTAAPESIVSEVSGTAYGLPAAPQIVSIVSNTANDSVDDAGIRTATVRIAVGAKRGFDVLEAA